MDGFHLTSEHVYAALESLASGVVMEGNVGGGTGMICHEFKGGIGTSSRVVETKSGTYTVGALVQANHGAREDFRINGVPVGRLIDAAHTPTPWIEMEGSSSIIIVVATDAPLLPFQCRRVAKRATVGFARAGGVGHNGSGDIFLAFATGNDLIEGNDMRSLQMIPNRHLNPLFVAAAEAVEESILNAVVSAETMTGWKNRVAYGLAHTELIRVMSDYPTGADVSHKRGRGRR
jgi:D-aminopeptidase